MEDSQAGQPRCHPCGSRFGVAHKLLSARHALEQELSWEPKSAPHAAVQRRSAMPDPEDPQIPLIQPQRCRRLAALTTDPLAQDLLNLAEEYEREASESD